MFSGGGKLEIGSFKGYGGGTSGGFSLHNSLHRADGGPVTAGKPYLIGERGWEVFVPNQSGTVVNQAQLGGMGGGTTINNITYSAPRERGLTSRRSQRQQAEQTASFISRKSKR